MIPSGASDDSVNIDVSPFVRTCCCPEQLEKGQTDESWGQMAHGSPGTLEETFGKALV